MRIGVDLDGVVYPFTEALREYAHRIGREVNDMPDPTTWHFDQEWGMTREEFEQLCHDAVDAGVLFAFGTPAEGTREALELLRAEGHSIHIVTARAFGLPGNAETLTRQWLYKHEIPFDSLTFSHDKTIVRTDTFIEDRPENFLALEAAGVDVYLMDQLYNRELETEKRVTSISEFVDRVNLAAATATLPPTGEVRTVSATGGEKGVKPARFDLIPAGPLWTVAELYGYGAAKYADRNWEAGYEWSKSFGAMQRHAWEFWNGVDTDDPEIGGSGLPHLASVVFHAFALMEWAQTHPEFDDRPSTKARAEWHDADEERYRMVQDAIHKMTGLVPAHLVLAD